MKVKLGQTTITCKHCGAVAAVDNEVLEAMRAHRCPGCNRGMSDYELARLKMHYYLMMTSMYAKHWGGIKRYERFDYDIDLCPHYVEEGEKN